MTELVVRKIPWEFDATVPFMWQPANPDFGLFCNAFTFIAVPFERYIVSVVRKAADILDQDPDVAAEADAFLRQEAQHAAAHRKHMLALVARYPELERCYEDACSAYDKLIDEQPIEFHAAYIANLEATFTPLFKVILDNRDSLFDGGDCTRRVVDDVALRRGDRAPKLGADAVPGTSTPTPGTASNTSAAPSATSARWPKRSPRPSTRSFRSRTAADRRSEVLSTIFSTRVQVPDARRSPRRARRDGPPDAVSRRADEPAGQDGVAAVRCRRRPHHDPADQPLPDWADTWMREYDRGTDMTTFVGSSPLAER